MTDSSTESSSEPKVPQIGQLYDDEIRLTELVQKIRKGISHLWDRRRFVSVVVMVSVGLGNVVAFGSRDEYAASLRILPYRGAADAGSAALTGLIGGRLPQAGEDQTISVALYPQVVKTPDFLIQLANTPLRFSAISEPMTAGRYFADIATPTVVDRLKTYTVGLPGIVLAAILPTETPVPAARAVEPVSEGDGGRPMIFQYDAASRAALGAVAGRLSVSSEGQGIVRISATMPDPLAAADLASVASSQLTAWVIEYEAKKATEQLRFLEEKLVEAEARLERIMQERARFTERNRGTVSPRLQLEIDRLQREYALAAATHQRFASSVEDARIRKSEDTPVFTVLERIAVPESPSSPKRGRILMLSVLLGAVGSIGLLVLQKVIVTFLSPK